MSIQEYSDALVTFVRTNQVWAAPTVFMLAFGESIAFVSLVLPFWGLLVAIGALVGFGEPQFWLLWAAASLGAAFGDWVSYWIGKYFKNDVGHIWPLSRHPDLLPRGHVFFEKWGAWAIVIGRFFGPLRAAVPGLSATTYIIIREMPASAWGYDGRTQADRALEASKR